jgi:hypothetical protein
MNVLVMPFAHQACLALYLSGLRVYQDLTRIRRPCVKLRQNGTMNLLSCVL